MLDPSIPLSGTPVQIPDFFGKQRQLRDLNDERTLRKQQIAMNDLQIEKEKQAQERTARVEAIIKGTIRPVMGMPPGGIPGAQPAPNTPPPGMTPPTAQAPTQTLARLNLYGPSLPNTAEPPVEMPSAQGQPPTGLQGTPDWDAAIAQMRAEGLVEEAQRYEDIRIKRIDNLLKSYGQNSQFVNNFFRNAGGEVSAVLDQIESPNPVTGLSKTDTEKNAEYQMLRPRLAAAFPGPFGDEVPVQYSRAALEMLKARGMTAVEQTDAKVKFARLGEEALTNAERRTHNYTLMLAAELPTAANQQQWDEILERVRLQPGGRAVADSFPQKLNDDAKTRARDRGIAAEKQAELELDRQREARLRAGDGGKPGKPELSTAQRGVAERWKHGELRTLEKAIRDANADGSPMSPDQIAAEKLRIQNGYLAQLGEEEQSELGPEWTPGPRKASPAPTATTTPAKATAKPDGRVPMTEEKAKGIIRQALNREATPEEVKTFIKNNPFER